MISHGMQDVIEDIFDEVHRSNMSKLGPDGKPLYREDGKVLKGPNYSPPNVSKYLSDNGQLEIPFDEEI
jgi:predicted HAD superfamily Cof-like phosphohydrolase